MTQIELLTHSFWKQVKDQEVPFELWPLLALLCRGFISQKVEEGVLILSENTATGGRQPDLSLLASRRGRLGLMAEVGFFVSAPASEAEAARLAKLLLRLGQPSANGMTARDDWSVRSRLRGWQHFDRFRWGPRVPVGCLDPGVALLVKVLPLVHVWTWLSCDGHGQGKAPFICACNEHYFRWLRGVMRHITPRHLQEGWQFEEAVEKGHDCRWTLGPAEEGRDAWARMHARNVQVARLLLDDPLLHKVKAARDTISSPEDLTDEWIGGLLVEQGVPAAT